MVIFSAKSGVCGPLSPSVKWGSTLSSSALFSSFSSCAPAFSNTLRQPGSNMVFPEVPGQFKAFLRLKQRKMALNNELQEQKQVTEVLTKTSYVEDENGYTPVSYEKIEVNTPEKSDTKFSNSEFISPIFGRLENNVEYPTVKKTVETKTYTETKFDSNEASDESDEFLNTLKEFRNNL